MAKRNYRDPAWRFEELWKKTDYDLGGDILVDDAIKLFQDIKAKALSENPSFKDFQVHLTHDEYELSMSISAMRPETEDEKLMRLGKHPAQLAAKKEKAKAVKAETAAEVRRLCKKLKVQSPI